MDTETRYEYYNTDNMLGLCQEFVDNGFNPEVVHRKGRDIHLSMSDNYLKSCVAGILVDFYHFVFEEIRKHLEFEPISLKGIKTKRNNESGVREDSITDYVAGITYDDKSNCHFTIYVDTRKMTTFGQIALAQAIEKRGDCQQLGICDDVENPTDELGWSLSYSINF